MIVPTVDFYAKVVYIVDHLQRTTEKGILRGCFKTFSFFAKKHTADAVDFILSRVYDAAQKLIFQPGENEGFFGCKKISSSSFIGFFPRRKHKVLKFLVFLCVGRETTLKRVLMTCGNVEEIKFQ